MASNHPQVLAARAARLRRPQDVQDLARARYKANSNRTAPNMLAQLAHHPDTEVRRSVARRRWCPPTALTDLAQDPELSVRQAVGANPSCPPLILAALVPYCAAIVAANPSASAGTLRRLVSHHPTIVMDNPSCPSDVLQQPYQVDRSVQLKIASHPSSPPQVLTELATDPNWYIRATVAGNPACPKGVAMTLLRDPTPSVRRAAAANRVLETARIRGGRLGPQDSPQ